MRRQLLSLLILAQLSAWGCSAAKPSDSAASAGTIRIATATRAGVYYPVGQAMADLWREQISGVRPEVLLTGGGPENVDLLMHGEAEVAFAQSGVVYGAATAPKSGTEIRARVRGLAYLYPNVMHLIARRDAGIRTPADLKGHRYIPGAEGSAAVINSAEVLSVYGITLGDLTVSYMGYAEAAEALLLGRADAALIPAGLPSRAVQEALASGLLELVPIDAQKVMKRYPWYLPFVVHPDTYPHLNGEVRTVAVANILIGRADLPEELVFHMVRALYEQRDRLKQAHPAADLRVEEALRGITGVLDLHPGAARYMRVAGVIP